MGNIVARKSDTKFKFHGRQSLIGKPPRSQSQCFHALLLQRTWLSPTPYPPHPESLEHLLWPFIGSLLSSGLNLLRSAPGGTRGAASSRQGSASPRGASAGRSFRTCRLRSCAPTSALGLLPVHPREMPAVVAGECAERVRRKLGRVRSVVEGSGLVRRFGGPVRCLLPWFGFHLYFV